jgi:hypothetical protein
VDFSPKTEYFNFWKDKNAVEGRNTLLINSLSKGKDNEEKRKR